ncbi:V-type proton ATPase subunit G 3 [Pipra filicauda]|uniref:V-type proton ATPase subunit G n=1 Tax=Pipra filicauda TaxID=649802 RepID=A0A6J2G190_9PASS|nr:V-type proton ATPase subunit G 3 [Pipra filicauda]
MELIASLQPARFRLATKIVSIAHQCLFAQQQSRQSQLVWCNLEACCNKRQNKKHKEEPGSCIKLPPSSVLHRSSPASTISMTSQSQGIQQLLQAEKRAKDKLEEAKKRKGKRLKQAKEEATAEIDHYRLQREKEFRSKQTNVMGSQGNLSAKIEEQTTENIRNLTSSYHKNMESMMKKLLSTICDINPEIHPNFRHAV